jgi:UDP-3-O-[3-hydroxymyristoyl] glucosamine N-acyltransferase
MRWALLRARLGRRLILEGRVTAGPGVRIAIARGASVVLGDGVELGEDARIEALDGSVLIGAGTRLGEGVTLAATGGIEIGADCRLGDHVIVVDADPSFADVETPVRLQPLRVASIRIGDGARIGAHAAILAGARVGERAVVGSYAVVRGAVPAGAVVTGAGRYTRARTSAS